MPDDMIAICGGATSEPYGALLTVLVSIKLDRFSCYVK